MVDAEPVGIGVYPAVGVGRGVVGVGVAVKLEEVVVFVVFPVLPEVIVIIQVYVIS